MQRFILIVIVIVFSCGCAHAGDYIRLGVDSIPKGTQNAEIPFYVERTCLSPTKIMGASNGFVITATGNATYSYVDTNMYQNAWFNMGGLLFTNGIDGSPPDQFLVGGAAMPPAGMPVVDDTAYFTLVMHIGSGTGQICVDSSFVFSAGAWKFSGLTCGQGGAPDRPLFVDKNGSDAYHPICIEIHEATCEPPEITNEPVDTLVADNCNKLEYQFEANPGGLGGGGNIHWSIPHPACHGEVDSLTGLFTFTPPVNIPLTWAACVCVTNDCTPPLADTCDFEILTTVEIDSSSTKRPRDGLPRDPIERSRFVFGPADAESVAVWIETDGTTAELEAFGIKFRPSFRENIYSSKMSVNQYIEIKRLSSVVRVTPMSLGSWGSSVDIGFTPSSPQLDTSTAYFFADSARSLYEVDGSGVIVGIIDREMNPMNPDFFFGPNDSKILHFWD